MWENVRIVQTVPSDIDGIMRLENLGFRQGIKEGELIFVDRIRVFPEGFLVVKMGDLVIGYICSELWEYKEEPDLQKVWIGHGVWSSHSHSGNEIYIASMVIDPSLRKQGVGSKLLKECLKRVTALNPEKIQSALLLVNENWMHARRIYLEEGFVYLRQLHGFFTPNSDNSEDAFVMRKMLNFEGIKK